MAALANNNYFSVALKSTQAPLLNEHSKKKDKGQRLKYDEKVLM